MVSTCAASCEPRAIAAVTFVFVWLRALVIRVNLKQVDYLTPTVTNCTSHFKG
jgi:hypothetical protein